MTNPDTIVRRMTGDDIEVVAALHVDSWRSAYRGIMADDYLDERAPADRQQHWTERLRQPSPAQAGFIAEHGGHPVGFVFLLGDADARYGTLLDNLHVAAAVRGAGVGRALLSAAAREIVERRWQRGLYLWVFAANTGARRFYERHGGEAVEHAELTTADGLPHPAVRYAWPDATVLIA